MHKIPSKQKGKAIRYLSFGYSVELMGLEFGTSILIVRGKTLSQIQVLG